MSETKNNLIHELSTLTINEALAKLKGGLTPEQLDSARTLQKRIDQCAYRQDDDSAWSLFAPREDHRQVALAALSIAISAMASGLC